MQIEDNIESRAAAQYPQLVEEIALKIGRAMDWTEHYPGHQWLDQSKIVNYDEKETCQFPKAATSFRQKGC